MRKFNLLIVLLPILISCGSGKESKQKAEWTEGPPVSSTAPSDTDRMGRIKVWYSMAIAAEKQPVNVFTGSSMEQDQDERFEQKVERALLQNGFEIITADYSGWGWNETLKYYFKDDDLFFVEISGAEISSNYQYKIYYAGDGNPISILHREGADDEISESKEVTGSARAEVATMTDQDLAKARKILRGR